MQRSPYCTCSERVLNGWSQLFSDIEEIHVNSVLYKRDGCYTVKKIITRLWEPSLLVAMDLGVTRHLCRRSFWCYLGMDPRTHWFISSVFPGWIQRREGIKALDPSREEERRRLVNRLKDQLEMEISRKLSAANARWTKLIA